MNFKVIFASFICALLVILAPSKAIAAIVSHAPINAMVNIADPTDGATLSGGLAPDQSKLPYCK